ncbi:thermonuclease family protein [Neisseria sp. Ec49-e6-T10]|uniref:thermonuclease family protein n=1 Tax=Neisseria sp. Ec49-e6-T10 TaxID=3140744 RepID=UPI003EC04107
MQKYPYYLSHFFVFFVCLFSLFFLVQCRGIEPSGNIVKVVFVIDGDTVTVLTQEQQKIKVRMAYIDAPEQKQAFGQKSKQFLNHKLYGKEVQLETFGQDRYGRTLARVWSESEDINLTMIQEGLAWHYQQYAKDKQNQESYLRYERAQEQAERLKIGLWQEKYPTAPWVFRSKESKSKK